MPNAIKHFMWGYQHHFRFVVEREAERLCEAIAPGLHPKVFLVGVRIAEDPQRYPACVEPEENHWAESAAFYDVLNDVAAIQAAYPESKMWHSHPVAQANASRGLFHRAVRDTISTRLEKCSAKPTDTHLFLSYPTERDGYLVMTTIEVKRSTLASIPAADDEEIRVSEGISYKAPKSLLHAAISQLFAEIGRAILEPDAGADIAPFGSTDDIIRRAGVRFFSGLICRVDGDALVAGIGDRLFDVLNRLSVAPYEGAEAKGHLSFAGAGSNIGSIALILKDHVSLQLLRSLRKLVVLTDSRLSLRCTCSTAIGYVELEPEPTRTHVDVELIRRGKWQVAFAGQVVMTVEEGHPRLPQPSVNEDQIAQDIRRLIPGISSDVSRRFSKVARCLAESGHGAILVVSTDAASEADRLASEGLRICPSPITEGFAVRASQIDGAVLCSVDGNCHAIGVILDGPALKAGDRGRGSRFNSSLRYALSKQGTCAVMVVSEDGGLELLPRLRPALCKRLLDSAIRRLEELATAESTSINREDEVEVIRWLEEHSFYLNEEQCHLANGFILKCEDRWRSQPDTWIWVERQPLSPDPAFNPARDLIA